MRNINSKEELCRIARNFEDKIYIVGAGNFGKVLGEFLKKRGIEWCGYVDVKGKGLVCGKKIISYEELKSKNYDCLIVSSVSQFYDIYTMLKKNKVDNCEIYRFESNQILIDLYFEFNNCVNMLAGIKKYKNCHENKRGFVIGNGPSLKIADLEKIKKEITFASNSIYALYDYTEWRPKYYGIYDFIALKKMLEKTHMIDNSSITMFTGIPYYNYIEKNNYNQEFEMSYLKIITGIHESEKYADFSDDAMKCVYLCGSITCVLLQLAVYMGIKEIYLLGVDFSFSAERNGRGEIVKKNVINHNSIIEKEEKELYKSISQITDGYNYVAEIDYQLWGYQAAKKYADAHGVKIYNATRGGNLEVFERVDFDSLFFE